MLVHQFSTLTTALINEADVNALEFRGRFVAKVIEEVKPSKHNM
ncbi:MAG: hypothetical protein ACJA0H_002473 [Francisellaceae bacterium]|jgi:hypothetical protein